MSLMTNFLILMDKETLPGTEKIVEAITEAVTEAVTEQTQQAATQTAQSFQSLPSEMTVSLNTITFIILIAIAVLLAVGLIFSLIMLKKVNESLESVIRSSEQISSDTAGIRKVVSDLQHKMDKAEEERKNRKHHEHSRQMSMQNQMYNQPISPNSYQHPATPSAFNGYDNFRPSQNEWRNTGRQDNRTENYHNYNLETDESYFNTPFNRQETVTPPLPPKREFVGLYSVSDKTSAFSNDIILSEAVGTGALFKIYSDNTVEVDITEQSPMMKLCGFYNQRKLGSVFNLESQNGIENIDLKHYIEKDLSINQLKKTAIVEPLNDGTYKVIQKGTLMVDIY